MFALNARGVRRWPAPPVLWLGGLAAIAVFTVVAGRAIAGGSEDVVEQGPPVLTASVGSQTGPLGLGSYSWSFDGTPVTEEANGIVTSAQVLTVATGDEIRIAGAGDLKSVEAYAFVRGEGSSSQEGANRLSWRAPGSPTPLGTNQDGGVVTVPIGLDPGHYLLSINTAADGGTAVYGLQLDVEARN